MRRPRSDERGVSLLLTMLLVLLLLVAVTGAAMRTTAERRSSMDLASQVDAFALAQSGIDRYLDAHTALPTSFPDSATYTMTGGRAVATLYRWRASASDTMFVLVSRGENTTQDRYAANAATAVRTVAQMIRFSAGTIDLPGAWTSLTPMDKNGNSGSLSGVDACTTAPAPKPSIPGVAVPTISAANLNPAYTGHTNPINGNPDNAAVAIGTPGVAGTAKEAVDIDWAGIVNRTSITPDYYRKTTAPASGAWPTSAQMNGTNWPIVFNEGDAVLPNNGQGILIVTGNLTINGSDDWRGLVLVGGTITSNGNNNITGGIVTGLNIKLGIAVPQQSVGNGNKTFQYNSCHIASAMGRFGGWQRLRNGWLDNWPVY
jgi:Tfp pilus assembly protein PilX